MNVYERRLAAAEAELRAAGLPVRKLSAFESRLLRLVGEEPRPWPYTPLWVRIMAYEVPFVAVWLVLNLLWTLIDGRAQTTVLATTLIAIPTFTLLLGLYERKRFCGRGLSRWEEL